MTIADAARATRKYWPAPHWEFPGVHFAAHEGYDTDNVDLFWSYGDAQAACDRLNLLAVLESDAIREPSENVARAARETADVESSYYESDVYNRWRAMIDALIGVCKDYEAETDLINIPEEVEVAMWGVVAKGRDKAQAVFASERVAEHYCQPSEVIVPLTGKYTR